MNQAIRKCAQFATLTAAVLLQVQAADAANVYATIEGVKMGVLKGDSTRKGLEDKTEVLKFEYSVKVPTDAAGMTRGRREHSPVRITKLVGPASPQLFQALVANEALRSVVIDFLGISPTTGQEYLQNTVRLTNAKIVGISQASEESGALGAAKHGTTTGARTLEEISFTFQTIEITNHDAKTAAMDSLSAP